MLKIQQIAVIAAIAAVPGARATRQVQCAMESLELDLRVDYAAGTISGTAGLAVRNMSSRPAAELPLLLNRLMRVTRVEQDGRPVRFEQRTVIFDDDPTRQVNAIVVHPVRPLPAGQTVRFSVAYGGVLVGYTETGSEYIRDHVDSAFTIVREDAYAFPVLGVPLLKADRAAPRVPFTFAVSVTVPAGEVVGTGGSGAATRRDSLTTWTYRSTDPVPFVNIAIAPYGVRDSAGSRIFFFPEDSAGARVVSGAVARALDRYADWFGPLGRPARLTVIEIPEGYGSQASISAGVLQTAEAFRNRSELPQLYHELSHLWNVRDLDQPSARWNEGLAMFLQYRMAAELDGWTGWEGQLARRRASLLAQCAEPPSCDSVPFVRYGAAGVTDRSYAVGMFLFTLLYRVLGPDRFDRAYRSFFQSHQGEGATPQDLVAAFRAVDPRSEAIFHDWLLTTRWHRRLQAGESLEQMVSEYGRS